MIIRNCHLSSYIHRGGRRPSVSIRPDWDRLENRTLLNAGGLDPTFGAGGSVQTDFPLHKPPTLGWSLAIDSQGRTIAAGTVSDALSTTRVVLVRYNPDGSLDTSFGTGGLVYTPIVAASALVITPSASVAIDSSGHIDVAGTETAMPVRGPTGLDFGTRNDFAVAQYNPDGSLNTSFGTAGVATIDIGTNLNGNSVPTDDYASGLAVQSDGKIVVSGTAFEPTSDPNLTDSNFAVTRLNVDGNIDSSFGNQGRAIANFPVTFFDFGPPYVSLDVATSLALTPSGKIVVAGLTDFGTFFSQNAFALAQFNTDGSLDSSFGTGGLVVADIFPPGDSGFSFARSVLVQPDGKIVAAGETEYFDPTQGFVGPDFALLRLNADGTPDASFGTDGQLITPVPGSSISVFNAGVGIALQPDGKLVTLGTDEVFSPQASDIVLARYNSDGSLDASFGSGGFVLTNPPVDNLSASAMILQPSDGKIIVLGQVNANLNSGGMGTQTFLERYNTDGSLDSTYGSGGETTTEFTASRIEYDLVKPLVLPDGKIVVAGTTATAGFNSGVDDFGLAEYNPNGSLNTSFGTDGTVITDIFNQFNGGGPLNHAVSGLALEMVAGVPKIVVAGTAVVQTSDGGVVDFALARYNLDGSLDTNFGNGGEITISPTTSQQFASGVAVQADGKIVVIGQVEDPSGNFNQSFCVVRVNTDGSLDSSFGHGGIVITDLTPPGTSFFSAVPSSIAIQPDGRIVVGGSDSAGSNLVLVRYKKDGKLDASFGNRGIVMLDSSVPGFPITDMTLQSDGKIVAVGSHFTTFSPNYGPIFDFGVARFTSKGNLDPSFGNGGIVITDLTPPGLNLQYSYDDNATGVVIQPDGKVVVGGWTSDPNTYPNANGFNPKMPALVRYDTSGSLDPTFGTGGISITGLSGSTFQGMALQPDGKILLPYTADANPWGGTDFGLARFLGMDLAIAGPVSGVRNQSLEFTGSFDGQQTDGTTSVTWQFGDGTTLKFHSASDPGALDVTHAYKKSGAYIITLTVKFEGGGTLTTSWQVSIHATDLLTDADHPSPADAVVKDIVSSGGRSDLALGSASGDSLTGGSGRGTLSRRGADFVVSRPGGGAGKYSVYLDLALDILLAREHSKTGASIFRQTRGS